MAKPVPHWTKDLVRDSTQRSAHRLQETLDRAHKVSLDVHKSRRTAMRECKWCFYYRHGVAGQAFTAYTCANCGVVENHPNTNVPKLCESCADQRVLCRRCGGTR